MEGGLRENFAILTPKNTLCYIVLEGIIEEMFFFYVSCVTNMLEFFCRTPSDFRDTSRTSAALQRDRAVDK